VKTSTKKYPEAKSGLNEVESADLSYHKTSRGIEPDAHWMEEESRNVPEEIDTSENLVHLYLSETRRTPMLTGHEEKRLGCLIEQEKHLSQLALELANKLNREPSASEIFITLLENFCRESELFKALCRQLTFLIQIQSLLRQLILD